MSGHGLGLYLQIQKLYPPCFVRHGTFDDMCHFQELVEPVLRTGIFHLPSEKSDQPFLTDVHVSTLRCEGTVVLWLAELSIRRWEGLWFVESSWSLYVL